MLITKILKKKTVPMTLYFLLQYLSSLWALRLAPMLIIDSNHFFLLLTLASHLVILLISYSLGLVGLDAMPQ